ncbi:hypothetical protein D092_22655 [Rhodococcus ruber Chol-4]|uniref:hypothetical protein n=1 Tax=Rhodococcus TaxID=1827 RepID=UPI00029B3E74|nr:MULTISPECIES: hypothetical protein [Rhodococcus]RIK13091.1 MAG: hypothetical protein DCC47_05115 [Acidobacteriota bacterium]ATQ30775.1 hypothetical protein CS378_19915 [Rhodococcus ruber]AUM16724.1 hypothetical protein CSW53_09370 [Rhodococcus ruber]AXY50452.1 hypothetical protein YT1_1008 [Rhodococcus ruber]KXF83962.1 hypothetical protein D092_22655 [Rhodococcus ruber Chol-4]
MADEQTSATTTTPETAPARTGRLLPALAAVIVLALAGAGVWLWLDARADRDHDARRAAYLQAARQTVLNLTTIHPQSAAADVQRLLDGATGDFKAEFEGREGPFVDVVTKANVDTTGEVIEAGIQAEDGACMTSLVAARSMVSNAEQTEPEPRDFRLRVTICDEDGRLLASKVDFVP